MLILERHIGKPMKSKLWYWQIVAIGFLFVAAVLSLLMFVTTSFIQIDADHKPISSALFFSHGAIERDLDLEVRLHIV